MGPELAQILGISGFVYFKTEEENATVVSYFDVTSKIKEKVFKAKCHSFLQILM